MLGKTEGEVGWHHQLNGPEFEKAPGDGEEQGSLACCSPQGHEELDEKQQSLVHNKFLTGELREGDGERGEKEGGRERRERESTKMLHPIPVIAGPYQIHQLL